MVCAAQRVCPPAWSARPCCRRKEPAGMRALAGPPPLPVPRQPPGGGRWRRGAGLPEEGELKEVGEEPEMSRKEASPEDVRLF